MEKTEYQEMVDRVLEIKSSQWDEHFQFRPLTQDEEAEIAQLQSKMAASILNKNQTKNFSKVVAEFQGKVLPDPETAARQEKAKRQRKLTKVKLTREAIFPYSGRSYITFPEGSCGYLVHNWEDLDFLDMEEVDRAKENCASREAIPLYIEGKLICLGRKDFRIVEDYHRDCA